MNDEYNRSAKRCFSFPFFSRGVFPAGKKALPIAKQLVFFPRLFCVSKKGSWTRRDSNPWPPAVLSQREALLSFVNFSFLKKSYCKAGDLTS